MEGDPEVRYLFSRSPLMTPPPGSALRALPLADEESATRETFRELAAQWAGQTGGWSNPHKRLRHPAYRAIVAMGWPVVPVLLAELGASDDPEMWGPALHEITGEQIELSPDDSGRPGAVARAWLALARGRGWLTR